MIKVFKFRVSNMASLITDVENRAFSRRNEIITPQQIENVVNEFLSDKELVSLQVSTIDVDYHNNGYSNTIDLLYTIVYEQSKNISQEVEGYQSVGEAMVGHLLSTITDYEGIELTKEERKALARKVDGLTDIESVEGEINRFLQSNGFEYNDDEYCFERK